MRSRFKDKVTKKNIVEKGGVGGVVILSLRFIYLSILNLFGVREVGGMLGGVTPVAFLYLSAATSIFALCLLHFFICSIWIINSLPYLL